MKIEFYKKVINTTKSEYYMVKAEKDFSVLENIDFTKKSKNETQKIIDGVQKSKDDGTRYEWANEDIYLLSDDDGVFFWDSIARRADKNHATKQDLQLTHDEFINFMKDFKKFIEENS